MAKRQICLVESWEGGLLSPVFSTANYNNYTVARNVIPVYEGLRDDPVYYLNAICIPLQLLTPPYLPSVHCFISIKSGPRRENMRSSLIN